MTNAQHTEQGLVPDWTLGHKLARALEVAGMTHQQMADELDVSRHTITNYVRNHTRPTRLQLDYWARRTGVSRDWLIESQPPRRRRPVRVRVSDPLTGAVTSRKPHANRRDNRRWAWSTVIAS